MRRTPPSAKKAPGDLEAAEPRAVVKKARLLWVLHTLFGPKGNHMLRD